MAKTDWASGNVVGAADMNALGTEVNTALNAVGTPAIVTVAGIDYGLNGTAAAWHDLGGGTAASHPHDLIIPNCEPGMAVKVDATFYVTTGVGTYFDMWTVVDGAYVSRFGGANTNEVSSWVAPANVALTISGSRSKVLTAADINADGTVRLRFRYWRATGTTTRTLIGTFGFEFRLEAIGPF